MLNIIVPMAGAGSRFALAGYKEPKPLIPVNGVPMIRLVIDNLRPSRPHRFIFVCQRQHVDSYALRVSLEAWAPGCEIVELDGLTQGAACTVLAAKALIDNDNELMIANSDQYVDASMDDYLATLDALHLDGIIMTMSASDPKWSFVGLNDHGLVSNVAEKRAISSEATVGIYNFRRGREFVAAAEAMIAKRLRVNDEYYVAPVYNELLAQGAKIGIFNIGREADGMYGLGIPQDLKLFLSLPISTRLQAQRP